MISIAYSINKYNKIIKKIVDKSVKAVYTIRGVKKKTLHMISSKVFKTVISQTTEYMSTVNADDALKEIVELTRLYDVYGPLLSDHKKEIFESYVLDNYSLAEIAEQVGISRQGVRDIVKRCSKELQEAEDKLGFLKKLDRVSEIVEETKEKNRNIEVSKKLEEISNLISS